MAWPNAHQLVYVSAYWTATKTAAGAEGVVGSFIFRPVRSPVVGKPGRFFSLDPSPRPKRRIPAHFAA